MPQMPKCLKENSTKDTLRANAKDWRIQMLSELMGQSCDVLKARPSFKVRDAVNWTATIVLFVAAFFFLMVIFGGGIAFVLSTAVAFCLFFFVLDKRVITILCNHCQKPIITNTPWVCGFCQKNNIQTDDFPFIHRCQHCGSEAKAYKCHHCGELIFLSEDQLKVNYAICIGTEKKEEPPPPDEATVEAAAQAREARSKEHEVRVAKLNAKLEEERRKAEMSKKKSPTEKVEESFSQHHAAIMAAHDIARRAKNENAEKYKDDPYLRERADEAVDAWLQQHL